MTKAHKKLAAAIKPYGLTLEKGGKHYVIKTTRGHMIGSVSASPSDPYFGRQAIRELVRGGFVPSSLKELQF